MMTLEEFHEAQEHNTKIINNLLNTDSLDGLNQIKFWEKPKRVSSWELSAKTADILGCCAIGAIPSIKPNGADGYAYLAGHTEACEIESKLASIDLDSVVVGPWGGICYSTPNMNQKSTRPTGITSKVSGSFDANMSLTTLESKARHTALICVDREHNKVIDAWMLAPNTVVEELKLRKASTNSPRLRISLAKFINRGWNIHTPVDKIGWTEWKKFVVETIDS